jgi:hypothetical protein
MGRLSFALGLVLLGASFAGPATAVTPPKGTPDLSRMGLRVADFPGSRVARQGYVKAEAPFVAAYERKFAPLGVRVGSKGLLALESDVELVRSVADARLFMAAVPLAIALLDPKDLSSGATAGGARPTYVRVGRLAKLRAGDQALELTIRLGTKAGEVRALVVFERVDRVIDAVVAIGLPRAGLGMPEATVLARMAAAHTREGLAPVNTTLPSIAGTSLVGEIVTASPGTWTNKPTGFSYSWQRCDPTGAGCVETGAVGRTYTVTTADAGGTVRVAVTAKNAIGSGRAVSAPTALVAGAPANTAPPTIGGGTTAVGQTLTASTGGWTGNPTSFAYQWQRCDGAGAGCALIEGAFAATYLVVPTDAGSTLRVAVTATNAVGSSTALSAATAVVT